MKVLAWHVSQERWLLSKGLYNSLDADTSACKALPILPEWLCLAVTCH